MSNNTYLVAKRDVKDFTIVDEAGYELTFELKKGSRLKIHEVVARDAADIMVRLFEDDGTCYVSADDFDVERR